MAEILVDGSNVLFWRGGQAQREALVLVIGALNLRRFAPSVYFDHSIYGYLSASDLATLNVLSQIIVAPGGTPADALLLDACDHGRIQIVSCDKYQDWQSKHPRMRRDWRVSGRIEKGGRVSFSKTLRAAPL